MAKRRQSNYSAAEKKAYYSGMGYRIAYAGKAIPFKNKKNRDSFAAGYAAAGKAAKKYPRLKKK